MQKRTPPNHTATKRPLERSLPHLYKFCGRHSGLVAISGSVPRRGRALAGCLDHNEFDMLAQKVLSGLAHDAKKDYSAKHHYEKVVSFKKAA